MKSIKGLLIAVGIGVFVAAGPARGEYPSEWWASVSETLNVNAKAEEGDAVVRVNLVKPGREELEEVVDAEGSVTWRLKGGKALPDRFWPGSSLISQLEVELEGSRIAIPERFWTDLAGFIIQKSTLELDELAEEDQIKAESFLAGLDRPRVIISADGGTLLIEWGRSEECDGRSTIRWIISKSGAVMRHRHTPPHEC